MMPTHKPTRRILLAIAAMAIGTAASCNLNNGDTIDFAYEGRILDAETKVPIEGAYALAIYEKVDLGPAGASRYCVKTKGMMTGKDGKFSFPIDKLDGNSPSEVAAIRPNYYADGFRAMSTRVWKAQNKETYSDRDVYLRQQDPQKVTWDIGQFRGCDRPESDEAIEAGIRFFEIEIAERKKYGIDPIWDERSIQYMRNAADQWKKK